jgi:hypothetical protein
MWSIRCGKRSRRWLFRLGRIRRILSLEGVMLASVKKRF